MKLRRISRSGTSLVVSLPPEILRQLELQAGDLVEVSVPKSNDRIVLKRATVSQEPKVAQHLEAFLAKYGAELAALREADESGP